MPSHSQTKDTQVSVRLPQQLKDRMEAYAELIGRSKSHVTVEALDDYLSWRIPQIEDLKQAVAAADAQDFADEDELRALVARYAGRQPSPAAKKGTSRASSRKPPTRSA